ncbi:uncharacterized protein LACBIDRAFT_318408 [Laccaria bicolor S238N-H82]|uniref:Predicted protein n=1 Tax=Laccaria bicolor (strain S238N-H82 / ATCC MYA-4686) TaxID=486041 RepID=B0E2G1_LACBS|nr:uncharacterized protein LACBIDRAFT_318408 [Laccaria bicolor S238N-H82]EDQ98972.1 predicted protein [Laccaria bicolor S238N-H82]|eukprot:XP_001890374.1 predicted protein [Laccaria bicolor S238N-H82]
MHKERPEVSGRVRSSAFITTKRTICELLFVWMVGYVLYQVYVACFGPLFNPNHPDGTLCRQSLPAATPSNFSDLYSSPRFRLESAKRLSGAIQIPTMTFDDMGPVDEDERWLPFVDMHKYLRDTFPLTHSATNLTVVGGFSLVYTWRGVNSSLKPLMLTGHLDVVPGVTSLDRWTYPPFDGVIDGEWIYGRGSGDCKNNVIGILTAVEHLIHSGWVPYRTIVLAFGQDEEVSGPLGATNIAKHLEDVYGKYGIAMIVDEGGMGLEKLYNQEFALPGIAEKGYMNAEVEVDMLGGHSSRPTVYTTIGILSKIVSAIESPTLRKESPIWGFISCLAEHGDKAYVPKWIRNAAFSKRPDYKDAARKFAQTSVENQYLIQTSKAATIFNAGVKTNALAESAKVNFNSRVDIFSSSIPVFSFFVPLLTYHAVDDVKKIFHFLVKPIAEKYCLLLNSESPSPNRYNVHCGGKPSIGNISLTYNSEHEASPIAPFILDAHAWVIFSKAVQASFGPEIIVSPSAMTGNTDTRFYWNLSPNIYRWSPVRSQDKINIHTVDEMISMRSKF